MVMIIKLNTITSNGNEKRFFWIMTMKSHHIYENMKLLKSYLENNAYCKFCSYYIYDETYFLSFRF